MAAMASAVKLSDLLIDGLLAAGDEVRCRGHIAVITADGRIHSDAMNADFDSPSSWATAVVQWLRQTHATCNGWTAVKVRDQPLDHFRQAYLAAHGGTLPVARKRKASSSGTPKASDAEAGGNSSSSGSQKAAANRKATAAASAKRVRRAPPPTLASGTVVSDTMEPPPFVAVLVPNGYGHALELCAACGRYKATALVRAWICRSPIADIVAVCIVAFFASAKLCARRKPGCAMLALRRDVPRLLRGAGHSGTRAIWPAQFGQSPVSGR